MKKLWITYAWKDNNEGDFDYIVQELKKVNIEAKFDRVALISGQRLWEQISENIMNGQIDGWAYLVSPTSLSSQPCLEELEYAVTRAIQSKDPKFPLIGLIHGVPFENVPNSLKVRLCIPIGTPNWLEQVKAGLEFRPPTIISQPQTKYICKTFENYNVTGKSKIVEIRPRFGEIMYWKFFVPTGTLISKWGFGPADGRDNISSLMKERVDGITGVKLNNSIELIGFGSSDKLSPYFAAKIVFDNTIPEFIAFGVSNGALEIPNEVEIFKLS